MSDEAISFAAKLIGSISAKNARKGRAINACIAGIVLLVLYLIMSTTEPDSFIAITVKPYFSIAVYYAVASLIATAYLVVKQPFVTPEVKHAQCNFCGGPMSTARLICEECKSKSDKDTRS